MAQRPRKPDDATEEATIGLFPGGPSPNAPPAASAELTPPPVGEVPPTAEPTLIAPPMQMAGETDGSGASTTTPHPTPSSQSTAGQSAEHMLTPTPIPGSSTPPTSNSGDSDESLGISGQIRPGQTLFGRYLVDSQLGEGGMGTVWLVRHLELDSFRALKLIIPESAFDPQARARFKREARVMARLKHPNAVIVHNASIGKDAAFIEMEYIRGQSLNKLMRAGVPMPLDWVARLLEQLCDVLQEAHDFKIVHRDLKPSNLMLVEGRVPGRERLKVLDFGIAKIIEAETEASGSDFRTSTGAFMGSALWTSPEQARGDKIDGRSDLYSVGTILYEMLTGYRPFGGQITKVIYDHLYTPPPKFAAKNPNLNVPPEIEQVVLRCLAKSPDERYQSARELAEAFSRALPPGMGASSSANHSGTDRALRSSPLEPPATEVASGNVLPATEPDKPAIHPDPFKPPTKPVPARWRALLPLAIMLGLVALGVYLATKRTLPRGYRAEYAEGTSTGALPSALIRVSDGARFIHIPGGSFRMGNDFDMVNATNDDEDQPAHPVTLSDFYMQETEVTNGEMEAYFIANLIERKNRPVRWQAVYDRIKNAGRDPKMYPAVGITHELAEAFAKWVHGKLPTEAQWEYAARSLGKDQHFVWGNEPKPSKRFANIDSLGDLGDGMTTLEVHKYPMDKTEQGIYDLTGNVREWCRDVYAKYKETDEPERDPDGPDSPKPGRPEYVVRGGSFASWPDKVFTTRPRRVDLKDNQDRAVAQFAEDETSDDIGFRVVIEWPRKP
jgi:eukaryotic-like serine/threonine-protein kinase